VGINELLSSIPIRPLLYRSQTAAPASEVRACFFVACGLCAKNNIVIDAALPHFVAGFEF